MSHRSDCSSRLWTAALGICVAGALSVFTVSISEVGAWPASLLESRTENCQGCHVPAGNWQDTSQVVIDIIDPETGISYKQPDGSFSITVKRETDKRVKSVFGILPDVQFPPDVVGWLYVSPEALQSAHESDLKFAPGWSVNRPFCGKRLHEVVTDYPGNRMAAITMTIRPSDVAENADIQLQVLFKSLARGVDADYFQHTVHLIVED